MKKNSGILTFFLSIFIFGFLIFKPAFSQDAALIPPAVQQFFDSSGSPLASGKVYFYQVGTYTFKDIYNSSAATTPYTNPITLNAGGKPPGGSGIYGIGLYRQLVKDKNGNTIWDAVTAPGGGGGGTPTSVGDGNAVGTILPWGGLVAPSQYVFTYGQEISRTSYPEFYSAITLQTNVICTASSNTLTGIADTSQIPIGAPVELALCIPPGSTVISKTSGSVTLNNPSNVSLNATARFFPYGNGNGSTTFNVPDFRGATLIGRNNMGGSASSRLTNGDAIGQVLAFTPTTYTLSQSSISLTSGSGTFSVGSNVSKLYIKMVAGGGGGTAVTTNNGQAGGNSSFAGWSVVGGSGGTAAGGAGGTGGSDGTGTKIIRAAGQNGSQSVLGNTGYPGFGGDSSLGGGGVNVDTAGAAVNAVANTGGGGSGVSNGTNVGTAGGGAGEYVEFYITNPISQYSYSVGAGGNGGAAGGKAGGNGAAGQIIIEATYSGDFADVLTPSMSGTADYSVTTNYIIKTTPDTPMSTETVVTKLGGMTGIISCGTGLTCADQTISVNSFGEATTAIKIPVKASTTANIGLFGPQTIDGVSVVDGDRVLVKDQVTASENGIYVVSNSNWTRATDFNETSELTQGTLIYVNQGSSQINNIYRISTILPAIGSNLNFSLVTGFANPSNQIGLTAINGNAATAMRSDAAPAINQSISPTWLSIHTFQLGLNLSGSLSGNTKLQASSAAGGTITFPNATDTVALLAASQALTNKSYNGLTISPSTGTLAIANGKTLTSSNSLTFSGTDSSSIVFGTGGTVSYIVASGTSALGTSAISASTCATVVTTAATGTATTDVVDASFNGDPTAVTGYTPGAMLSIVSYPSANNVNFKVCNNTSGTITPSSISLNWKVRR